MANLVDIGNSTGIDLASDEALLTNDTGVACVEGGVYAVDPSSALMDVAGTYKWTSVKLSGIDDMRIGMFVVSRDAVRSSTQGQFVGHSQMRVLCSAENGVIVAGDLLVPVPGKTYLVRASDGDLVSRRPVGRAVVGMSATTPALTWCYFSGLAPFFGSANLSPGVVDEQMTTMFDKTTVLTNYFAYQNSDFQSNGGTTWMVLPPAFVPSARMVNGCLILCDCSGGVMTSDLVAETYIFELMVNGTATGLTMTFSPTTTNIGYIGYICFTAEMRVWPQSGSLGGETVVYVIGRLRRFSDTNAAAGDNTVAIRTTLAPGTTAIDTTKDNMLQWRVRHGTGTNHYMNWTNIMCYMPVYGTGA